MEFVNDNTHQSSTVNFEDLFDFSPEPSNPVDSSPSVYQLPVRSPNFAPTTGNPVSILSSSLPSNWKDIGLNSRGVRELLEDLPEVLSESCNDSLLGTSAPLSQAVQPPTRSKRGRKPGQKNLKTDMKSKLERSRQSARECRARKKLRYQYLDDLILEREKANVTLREELFNFQKWCHEIDKGNYPEELKEFLRRESNASSTS